MDRPELHRSWHRSLRSPISLAAAGAIALLAWGGCAPRGPHPELVAARAEYMRAQSDPSVRQIAPVPLHEADRVLRRAEEMWAEGADRNEVDQLTYLGRSQVQAAQTMAAYEQARLDIEATKRRLAAQRQRERDAEPTVQSAGASNLPLDVRAHSASDGSVGGTLFNRSANPIADVQLMVNYAWLWKNETHPGDVSPSRSEYFRVAEQIPPGGSVNFSHRPLVPLPLRSDGHFETSLEVVAFEEIEEIRR